MRSASRRRFLQAASLLAAGASMAILPPSLRAAIEPMKSGSGKAKFNLAIASYTFREFDRAQVIAWTKQLDIKYLGLKSFHLPLEATDEECRKAAEECQKAGIDLVGCGTITFGKPADIDNALRYAKTCGMKTIVCTISKPELVDDLLKYLDAKIKETDDIVIALHNHGPGDKVFPTAQVAYEKVKNLDKRIGFCVDIGHTKRIGSDPIADLTVCPERLFDVHFKDLTKPDASGVTCVVGSGVLEIRKILETLIAQGYDRCLSFEYESHGKAPFPYVAESVGFTRGMLAMM